MFFETSKKKWVLSKNCLRIAVWHLVKILISKKVYKPQIHPRAPFTHTGDLTLSLRTSSLNFRVWSHFTLGGGGGLFKARRRVWRALARLNVFQSFCTRRAWHAQIFFQFFCTRRAWHAQIFFQSFCTRRAKARPNFFSIFLH